MGCDNKVWLYNIADATVLNPQEVLYMLIMRILSENLRPVDSWYRFLYDDQYELTHVVGLVCERSTN